MLVTAARLLRLLTLLQSRSYWTGSELAERLEVTERTVRRDVDRLRTLGYPVRSSSGIAGGYQLGAGTALPPLVLDDDEALAVTLGLRTAAAGTVAGVEEPALRALAKLEQMMPQRLRGRVAALHEAVVPLYHQGPRIDSRVLSVLAGACRGHVHTSFRYEDGNGRVTRRRVEPHGLVHTGARWYLVAWDEDREDWRTFRVDRIQGAKQGHHSFTPREIPEGSAADFVSRSVASLPYLHQARLVFFAPSERVASRVPPLAGFIQPLGEDRCRMETGAPSLERLALYVALVGEDFQVEDPPELETELRTLANRIRRALRKSRSTTRQRGPSAAQ